MDYNPDNWVILKIKEGKGTFPFYKVLAGWSGGYLDGDSWRMNSGIVNCTSEGDYWHFHGHSGSVYKCGLDSYGISMSTSVIYDELIRYFGNKVELMPEDTNWTDIEW